MVPKWGMLKEVAGEPKDKGEREESPVIVESDPSQKSEAERRSERFCMCEGEQKMLSAEREETERKIEREDHGDAFSCDAGAGDSRRIKSSLSRSGLILGTRCASWKSSPRPRRRLTIQPRTSPLKFAERYHT